MIPITLSHYRAAGLQAHRIKASELLMAQRSTCLAAHLSADWARVTQSHWKQCDNKRFEGDLTAYIVEKRPKYSSRPPPRVTR